MWFLAHHSKPCSTRSVQRWCQIGKIATARWNPAPCHFYTPCSLHIDFFDLPLKSTLSNLIAPSPCIEWNLDSRFLGPTDMETKMSEFSSLPQELLYPRFFLVSVFLLFTGFLMIALYFFSGSGFSSQLLLPSKTHQLICSQCSIIPLPSSAFSPVFSNVQFSAHWW